MRAVQGDRPRRPRGPVRRRATPPQPWPRPGARRRRRRRGELHSTPTGARVATACPSRTWSAPRAPASSRPSARGSSTSRSVTPWAGSRGPTGPTPSRCCSRPTRPSPFRSASPPRPSPPYSCRASPPSTWPPTRSRSDPARTRSSTPAPAGSASFSPSSPSRAAHVLLRRSPPTTRPPSPARPEPPTSVRYDQLADLATELPAVVRGLTGGAGVHTVFDGVGAATFEASLASLRPRGGMALFGGSSGAVPPLDPDAPGEHGFPLPDPAEHPSLHGDEGRAGRPGRRPSHASPTAPSMSGSVHGSRSPAPPMRIGRWRAAARPGRSSSSPDRRLPAAPAPTTRATSHRGARPRPPRPPRGRRRSRQPSACDRRRAGAP